MTNSQTLDLTPEEREKFQAYGIGFAPRNHGFYRGYTIETRAMISPNSEPTFYPAVFTDDGGETGSRCESREAAHQQGIEMVDRIIADRLKRGI